MNAAEQLAKAQRKAQREKLELELKIQLQAERIHGWVREFEFHETRGWRFDYAFPRNKVALECEGGIWSGGAHATGAGIMRDIEKYNAALLRGWIVYRITADMLKKGIVAGEIRQLILQRGGFLLPTSWGKCKRCGQRVAWLETQKGRKMPTEPDGVEEGDQVFDPSVHISHFSNCPPRDESDEA